MTAGTKSERNATAEPQTEAAAYAALCGCSLVTIAGIAKRNGPGREGERADRQPVECSNPRDGHGAEGGVREVLGCDVM